MRVLVTGASGFLGYHLTRLLEPRHETMATYCSRPVEFEKAEASQFDLRIANQCARLVAGFSPSHIVHAAAMTLTGECEKDPDQARLTNVQGTQNLLDAAQALEPRPHFIFVSTDLVFNGQRGRYREIDPTDPLQVYGQTKVLMSGETTGRTARANGRICTKLQCSNCFRVGTRIPASARRSCSTSARSSNSPGVRCPSTTARATT